MRTRTTRLLLILGVAGIGADALLLRIPYEIVTSFIPPEAISKPVLATIHEPYQSTFRSPEQGVMVAQGNYLFTVTSCAMLHQGNEEEAGKTSWAPSGTRLSRDISSHPTNGISAWSDEAVTRALRSDVSVTGRALHRQGMIWDHAPNRDEEDVCSLIASIDCIHTDSAADRPESAGPSAAKRRGL